MIKFNLFCFLFIILLYFIILFIVLFIYWCNSLMLPEMNKLRKLVELSLTAQKKCFFLSCIYFIICFFSFPPRINKVLGFLGLKTLCVLL